MASLTEEHGKSLTEDLITEMCKSGFGNHAQIESIHELGGGTFNTTYQITFADQFKTVLRVAPPQTADIAWDEIFLMRREHSMQPYFAPIATLMPKTLLVDFTHQVLDRDYIFQSYIEGERWDDVMSELTPSENNRLWEQFGGIMKQIHNVHGESFGLPLSGFQFSRWSETIMDRMKRTLQSANENQIELPNLTSIMKMVLAKPQKLDEIQVPALLHGDLWSFNILIRREAGHPSIVGILDADRTWWGDPMADWTMFILAHAEKEEGHEHFWQAYDRAEDTPGSRCRVIVYDAMHASIAFLWAVKHQDEETVTRATGTLREVLETLPALL